MELKCTIALYKQFVLVVVPLFFITVVRNQSKDTDEKTWFSTLTPRSAQSEIGCSNIPHTA